MLRKTLRALTMEDRGRFEAAFGRWTPSLSAHSFVYHFLWRDHFDFEWAESGDHTFLFARYDDHVYMPIPPMGPFDPRAVEAGWEWMQKANRSPSAARIENIPEACAEEFQRLGLRLSPNPPEYLYRRDDLSRLPGDRYKSQRWASNCFSRREGARLLPYTPELEGDCRALFQRWHNNRQDRSRDPSYRWMLEDSGSVHDRALKEAADLGLVGRVLQSNGGVAGYTFGYPICASTFCILLEVSDLDQRGAAAYLFRNFCRELSHPWINTLDDSGLDNLRRVKEGYRPAKRLAVYVAGDGDRTAETQHLAAT